MSETFRAFVAEKTDDGHVRGVRDLDVAELGEGGVLVDVAYSSVNYKDALAASEKGRVARISPLVVGIDLVGTVVESDDPAFAPGDAVIAHGYDIGVAHHGGFAELARVPATWVLPLPAGLDPREAMVIGTAGFTAAMSIVALLDHGLTPDAGPVLVTGATGGVGSAAVAMLAGLGFAVTASSGKPDAADFLRALGAQDVVTRDAVSDVSKPLLAATWAGAVDSVGGTTLAHVLATLAPGGAVAASGNVGGAELPTTVLPFILRGVALFGIDSAGAAMGVRRRIWERAATDLKPADLDAIATEIGLDELEAALEEISRGGVTGRYVVALGS